MMIYDLKAVQGINVNYICCNIAGENNASDRPCREEWISKKFEDTMKGMLSKTIGLIIGLLHCRIE